MIHACSIWPTEACSFFRWTDAMQAWEETEIEDRKRVQTALYSSGCDVDDVYELVNRRGGASYQSAIPALVEILPTLKANRIKEGVVRALGVRQAVSAGPALVREFKTLGPADSYSNRFELHLHWAIGNSLSEVADDSLFQEIVDLVEDLRYGRAREMLAYALTRMRSRRDDAVQVLVGCLSDGDLCAHAIDALAKLKAVEARPEIEKYLKSSERLVRSEAKKALRKLQKQV